MGAFSSIWTLGLGEKRGGQSAYINTQIIQALRAKRKTHPGRGGFYVFWIICVDYPAESSNQTVLESMKENRDCENQQTPAGPETVLLQWSLNCFDPPLYANDGMFITLPPGGMISLSYSKLIHFLRKQKAPTERSGLLPLLSGDICWGQFDVMVLARCQRYPIVAIRLLGKLLRLSTRERNEGTCLLHKYPQQSPMVC